MEIAAIRRVVTDDETARRIANEVCVDLETRLVKEVRMEEERIGEGAHGAQSLLVRTCHYVARRGTLALVGAAAREADMNDPSRAFFMDVQEPAPVGMGEAMDITLAADKVCELGRAPADVKLRADHTYVFRQPSDGQRLGDARLGDAHLAGAVDVLEYASKDAKLVLDDDMNRGDTLNGYVCGALIVHGVAEDVFVKEKHIEQGYSSMDVILR